MSIDDDLLAILACPSCRAPLRADRHDESAGDELVCTGCGLAYPVRDDIPVLLVEHARRPEPPAAGAATEPADGE